MSIPRPEHPKPQFCRENWENLNGPWQFEIDNGRSGLARGLARQDTKLAQQIVVPFCPQSKLSGIAYKDFMYGVWYKRQITLTSDQLQNRVRLHFGAVDYRCTVYVNEKKAGMHQGGYTSFYFDITDLVQEGENTIAVFAEDDERDPMIPRGKQSEEFFSHDCDYTRTTGIWQTVWLEFLPAIHLDRFRIYPDAATGKVTIIAQLCGSAALHIKALYEGRIVGETQVACGGGSQTVCLPLSELHLWEVGCGRLYDLELTYGDDRVSSYFGLRTVSLDDHVCRMNGKPVFQRLILDQGFYPDSIYTAPSDAELIADIERSMAMGFNGARLHEKVFEERFLYHADRLGYMVWGEYPNWGLQHTRPEAIYAILPDWLEELERDFNHPAIVGWCPFNETWNLNDHPQYDPLIGLVYRATKTADPTRPCIDTSGNFHVKTDIFDLHDYVQDPEKFAAHYPKDAPLTIRFAERQTYGGQPVMISEYGGIGYHFTDDDALTNRDDLVNENGPISEAWSYGNAAATKEEFIARFKGLTDVLLDNPSIMGLCYTQLTDVEQEQNGLYTYDRRPKVEPAIMHAIMARKAAIEKE